MKQGRREKKSVKVPLLVLAGIIFTSILVNIYLYKVYHIPLFMNFFEVFVGIFIGGSLIFLVFLIIAVTNFVVRNKNYPKSVHNPKMVWYIPGFMIIIGFVLLFFAYPTGEKLVYVDTVKEVKDIFKNDDSGEEMSLALLKSERDCLDCKEKGKMKFIIQTAFSSKII